MEKNTVTLDTQVPAYGFEIIDKSRHPFGQTYTPLRGYIQELFKNCLNIVNTKANDYASKEDYHSNFRYSEFIAKPFPDGYKPYVVLIGVKLARLGELLQGKEVKHESIEDSFLDLVNYCALMAERYYLEKEK